MFMINNQNKSLLPKVNFHRPGLLIVDLDAWQHLVAKVVFSNCYSGIKFLQQETPYWQIFNEIASRNRYTKIMRSPSLIYDIVVAVFLQSRHSQ